MTTTTTAATTTKRHPIRGFLYGIVFGLGLALIAIGQKWAALGTWPPLIILVIGVLAGTAWSTFGPAKAPKGPVPTGSAAPEPPLGQEPEPAATADESVTEEPVTEGPLTEEPLTEETETD